MTADLQARLFFVAGDVQGVGFRFFTQRVAARLGVAGYVKNLRDGRVEVYAIGAPALLDSLRAELARGPAGSAVSQVGEQESDFDPHYQHSFTIEQEW